MDFIGIQFRLTNCLKYTSYRYICIIFSFILLLTSVSGCRTQESRKEPENLDDQYNMNKIKPSCRVHNLGLWNTILLKTNECESAILSSVWTETLIGQGAPFPPPMLLVELMGVKFTEHAAFANDIKTWMSWSDLCRRCHESLRCAEPWQIDITPSAKCYVRLATWSAKGRTTLYLWS